MLAPLTELAELRMPPPRPPPSGVSGGVLMGRPATVGLIAVTLGTDPTVGVGLLTTEEKTGGRVDTVTLEEDDTDRAGLAGRAGGKIVGESKGGALDSLDKFSGAATDVGVKFGVACAEPADVISVG